VFNIIISLLKGVDEDSNSMTTMCAIAKCCKVKVKINSTDTVCWQERNDNVQKPLLYFKYNFY